MGSSPRKFFKMVKIFWYASNFFFSRNCIINYSLDILPTSFDTPMFWTEEELAELRGTSVVGLFDAYLMELDISSNFGSSNQKS